MKINILLTFDMLIRSASSVSRIWFFNGCIERIKVAMLANANDILCVVDSNLDKRNMIIPLDNNLIIIGKISIIISKFHGDCITIEKYIIRIQQKKRKELIISRALRYRFKQ